MLAEETCKESEVSTVGAGTITSQLIHRQRVAAIDLGARRTTHRALGLQIESTTSVELTDARRRGSRK